MAVQRPLDDEFTAQLTALIPQMRAFARALCRDHAEGDDVAQEALLKAWNGRDRYEPGSNLKAWTFMIIRNQFYSLRRRSWRATQLDPEIAERTLTSPTNPLAAIELEEVRQALALLEDDQRVALVLIGAGGLSYEEASEICGCPIGTIKSRVSRARQRLQAILNGGELGPQRQPADAAMRQILQELDALRGGPSAA